MSNSREIVIISGTGGVGKTTLSAALAIRAAMEGKRAAVITIDPAKRLKTALGMHSIGNTPEDLSPHVREACKKLGIPVEKFGSFAALVPDTHHTLEGLFSELAPSPAVAQKITANPIFKMIASEFSGANEYMAVQRLETLYRSKEFDLIVLDTPPNRNVLGFLESPSLLSRFFDEKLFQWILSPSQRWISLGLRKVLSALEKLTGAGFITHLFDFGNALFEIQVGFTEKMKSVNELFRSNRVGFLLVTSPSPNSLSEIQSLADYLEQKGYHFDGILLNRTLNYFKVSDQELITDDPELKKGLQILLELQKMEKGATDELRKITQAPLFQLPEFVRDIHSIEDLIHVARVTDSHAISESGIRRSNSSL